MGNETGGKWNRKANTEGWEEVDPFSKGAEYGKSSKTEGKGRGSEK